MEKILIVMSMNGTPEEEIEERLEEMRKQGIQFRVVSANTSLHPIGEMDVDDYHNKFFKVARHVYYVTTVVLSFEG